MPDHRDTLTGKTIRAGMWRLANSVVGAVSQFAVSIPLARLLAPEDFGLMSLALVVLGLASGFGDLGMGNAIVQRKLLSDRYIRTALTFSVILGITIAAIFVLAAPIGALVANEPRVTPIIRWASLSFAIQGASVVAEALLRRSLDYKRRFFIGNTGFACYAAVAIALAHNGYAVWSLVWGSLAQAVLTTIANLALVRHPMRPLLSREELTHLLHFGVGSSLSGWMNYLARNSDNFIVGRFLGAANLGLYARAYSLMNLPFTHATSLMSAVLFPAMSQLQDDTARLRRAYLLMTQLVATTSAVALAALGVAAPYLILGLYGPQWIGAVAPLQILCAFGYFRALYHVAGIVAQSAGRIYGELRNQLIYASLVILGAIIGVRFGISGVATGVGVAICAMFIASCTLAHHATHTSWRTYFGNQIEGVIVGLATLGAALAARRLVEWRNVQHATEAAAIIGLAAAVPACVGLLWVLSGDEFRSFVTHLPGVVARSVGPLRVVRRRFSPLP